MQGILEFNGTTYHERPFKREELLEKAFCKAVVNNGGIAKKLSTKGPFGYTGDPDRMVLLPGAVLFFIEFKMPGEQPTEIQLARHAELRQRGFEDYVCDRLIPALVILYDHLCPNEIRPPRESVKPAKKPKRKKK